MSSVPARCANRFASSLKRFQPIIESAKQRDVNESDTVVIVTDLLSQMFGYDKYSELTSEVAIRGTFCDLATKVDGKTQFLIEVKAIGTELKDGHTRQALDYAATEGVDWVVLTNGALWKVFTVKFGKPIEPELVTEFDLLGMESKNEEHIEQLFLLSKEGLHKDALRDYDARREALSRFCVAAVVRSEPVIAMVRRELRRLSPDVKIDVEQVASVLERDVLKRDVLEGDKAEEARRRVARHIARAKPKTTSLSAEEEPGNVTETPTPLVAEKA